MIIFSLYPLPCRNIEKTMILRGASKAYFCMKLSDLCETFMDEMKEIPEVHQFVEGLSPELCVESLETSIKGICDSLFRDGLQTKYLFTFLGMCKEIDKKLENENDYSRKRLIDIMVINLVGKDPTPLMFGGWFAELKCLVLLSSIGLIIFGIISKLL